MKIITGAVMGRDSKIKQMSSIRFQRGTVGPVLAGPGRDSIFGTLCMVILLGF